MALICLKIMRKKRLKGLGPHTPFKVEENIRVLNNKWTSIYPMIIKIRKLNELGHRIHPIKEVINSQ